jgi:hypothetical protein
MIPDSTGGARPDMDGDERWVQWIAKGHAHDRQVRDQVSRIAFSIFAVAAFLLAARLALE